MLRQWSTNGRSPAVVAPPRVLVNSLPKSGTHLVAKILQLIPLYSSFGNLMLACEAYSSSSDEPFSAEREYRDRLVPIRIGAPHLIPMSDVDAVLARTPVASWVTGHIPHSPEIVELLNKYEFRTLLVLRDLRDVVVSHAHFVYKQPENRLYPVFKDLSFEERLMISIVGYRNPDDESMSLGSIDERYRRIAGFTHEPINVTLRFERLVGSRGGASDSDQRAELRLLANHLGLTLSDDELEAISTNLFGGTETFRQGQAGTWREAFSPDHKRVFKEIAGRALIEMGYEEDFFW